MAVQPARQVSGAGWYLVETAWGWCGLRRGAGGISKCSLPSPDRGPALLSVAGASSEAPHDTLLEEAARLLVCYFDGEPVSFDLPVAPEGMTEFGNRVLEACAEIPRGETRSYGEVAAMAGSAGAARAVGQALARNPLPVIVPCHRVIGADGSLTGFGDGLTMKRRLLELERVSVTP
jgi:methylated-DNA-[protein]-cysteine S-methyltransferase